MKKLLLTLLTTSILASCSSNDDSSNDNPQNNEPPSLETHLISKVNLFENTQRHIDYTYNSNNQLTEGITSEGARQTFQYHSNGLISENAFYNSNQVFTGKLVLEYNSSGNINKLFLTNDDDELNVNYISNSTVEVLRTNTVTNSITKSYLMEMNSNNDMSNLKIYNSNNELENNVDFLYDSRGNVSQTISYDINSGAETILQYEWGNGLTYNYNQASLLYERMPNGMSLSDFVDLIQGSIEILGNGMNPRLDHIGFDAEYTFYSNGMSKTQRFIYQNGNNPTENSFTYEYINKN